jgi:TolB-like protein/ankyrin repeat protein
MTLIAVVVVLVAVAIGYWSKSSLPQEEPASIENMAFPLPDKPSIAVLPFTNMSDDPKQEYFADGMTEDLITDLSKISGLFVIARNSSFSYKGQQVKVRQVAEDLGVRYVLEGSVRRFGDQVRINAQLIDATTGGHLWADRYDGSMADVFALQDKVTEQIVKALALNIKSGPVTPETMSAQAYDAFLKGWASYQRHSKDDLAKAIPLFETAVNLDESYTQAHTALAAVYWEIWQNQWAEAIGISRADAMQKIKNHLQEAMQEPSPLAHRIASNILIAEGSYETAAAEAEKIIALDSNDASGYAILASALALSGKTEESKSLLAKAERLDPFASRLHAAVLKGETDTVRQLIAEGVPVDGRNHQGRTALHLTAFNDHAAIANLLIEAGADIEKPTPRQAIEFRDFGSSPLALTAARGSSEVAKLLIAAGADVNARSLSGSARWAALHYAAVYGHADVAKLLIDSGAAIDVLAWNAQTPLYKATLNGDLEMVELLIEHGGEVNTVNDRTRMPLHAAIQSRDMKIVQLLIAKGVNVNARTTAGSYPGESALHVSAFTGQVQIAELLLINGARIDAPDQSGYTPLRRSIDNRNTGMAKLLISKGADITTQDVYGISLLHVLAQSDDVDLAALLINAGVDVNARDKNLGFTPLDYAQGGELNMIELLKLHGSICTSC